MTSTPEIQTPAAPSIARLVRTTLVALVVAAILLITFVLPSEYGVDPLGIGRRLGLTDIASPPPPVAAAMPAEGAPMAPTQNGPIGEYPREFKVDVFDFVLQPYEYLEYKYQLEKGATMLYAWTAEGDVQHDFHGERAAPAAGETPEQSFDKTTRRQATGAYTALFSGMHGWYWENPGGEPIKVHLTSAGFYSSAVEIHSNRSRYPHTLRPLVLPPAEGQTAPAPPNPR